MGATGAVILAIMKGRLSFDLTRQAAESTAKLSAFVVFILLGARVFSLTFYGVDGHRWVEELLISLPGGQVGFLIAQSVILALAIYLDRQQRPVFPAWVAHFNLVVAVLLVPAAFVGLERVDAHRGAG